MPFFNKELSSAHKKRMQLRNRYLYTKQRNFCVSLLRKTKKKHYANLNHKDIADNKPFWRTVKQLLSDESKSNEKITLVEDVFKEIKRLKARKPTKEMLKENADIFSAYICDFLNETIKSGKFPAILKNGDITAVFKKGFKGSKENYRPVSILPIISKIFERIISKLYGLITITIPMRVSKGF